MYYNIQNISLESMDIYLDILLNLPDVTVKHCQKINEGVCLHIELLNSGAYCPKCQHYTEEINQVRYILIRDLPISGNPVYLKVPRRQFICSNCPTYFTESLDYIQSKRHHTQRYELQIYQKVIVTNIEQVGREEGLNYDEVKAMFDAESQIRQKKTWSPVKRIGLDELSTRKGHKHFQTVIADIDRGFLIDIFNTHKTDELIEILMQQPLQVREGVEEL